MKDVLNQSKLFFWPNSSLFAKGFAESPCIPTVINIVRKTKPWRRPAPRIPACSNLIEKREATAAVTIPLGANQAKNIFSFKFYSLPVVAIQIEIGRTITINIKTQITPPHPSGLNSPQETSAAKRGKRTVIAN